MSCTCRSSFLWLTAAFAFASLGGEPARGGQMYRFTSTINNVLDVSSPAPGLDLSFAVGQQVAGTFFYAPELAVLAGEPSDGAAFYRNAFTQLKLEINRGGGVYRFVAPDFGAAGTPVAGAKLNSVGIDDNVVIDGGGRTDGVSLYHNNQLFFDRPWGTVAPESMIGQFYPAFFGAFWRTDTTAGQPLPTFITNFSLPSGLNELFPRSANDNWTLQFVELPAPGTTTPGRRVNLLGRMTTLQVIAEPNCVALACVAAGSLLGARRKRAWLFAAIR